MTTIKIMTGLLIIIVLAGVGFIYSGIYPIGADQRHSAVTFWILETLRKRSITNASEYIQVPPLDDPQLLLSGGADYNDMCAGCHLKPGVKETDMTIGLYPSPPSLIVPPEQHDHGEGGHDDSEVVARQQFWVIKHGIMASGMAAFGPTHSDERIWAMVAFLRKLPELNETQYQILTSRK